jgi:hypothetical protein
MPFSIDTDDFDDLADELEQEAKALSLESLQYWASEIEKEARYLAAEVEAKIADSIHIVVTEVTPRTEPSTFEVTSNVSESVVVYLVAATRNKLPDMPFKIQMIFEEFLEALEEPPSEK